MRVVLVSTPTRIYAPNYIVPTGIIALAAHLELEGHEVHVVDAAALREPNDNIIQRIAAFDPQLIGIGGIITAYAYIIRLTHDIRKALPTVPIALGGQVTINNTRNCYEHMAIDWMVYGYGEIPLGKLVRHLEGQIALADIPGISYREDGSVVTNPGREFFRHVDDMPLPAYHLIDMEHYATVNGVRMAKLQKYLDKTGKVAESHRFCTVMGTLGCTDRCTFCVHEQEYVGLKVFSNDYLLRHIRLLYDTYNIRVFALGEEMFITKLNRAREFNNLMKENFPDAYWQASTRADFVTPEMVAELETGNCYTLAWGFESGSTKMLDLMKKRMTREQNILAYQSLDKSKLIATCSLMVGNVGETNETIKETVSAIREGNIGSSAAFFASAYPGGRTWDWAVEQGIISDTHQYLLAASNKDAGSKINVNLTPYPDFILKAWQQMLAWECRKQEQSKAYQLYSHERLRSRVRRYLSNFLGKTLIPTPIVRHVVDAYFAYYRLSRRFYRTTKDRMCAYQVDKAGSILPRNLIVGDTQGHLSEEKVAKLLARPRVHIPIRVT